VSTLFNEKSIGRAIFVRIDLMLIMRSFKQSVTLLGNLRLSDLSKLCMSAHSECYRANNH